MVGGTHNNNKGKTIHTKGRAFVLFTTPGCGEACDALLALFRRLAEKKPQLHGRLWHLACAQHAALCQRRGLSPDGKPAVEAWGAGGRAERYRGVAKAKVLMQWVRERALNKEKKRRKKKKKTKKTKKTI